MFISNLKLALRILNKNKLFSAISILSLSIALAISFIILLYVVNELSYDYCHKKHDRIYRVLVNHPYNKNPFSGTPYVLATALKDEYPQIEKIAWFSFFYNLKLKLNGEYISMYSTIATDPEIFDIFTIPLNFGSSHDHVLKDKNSIALSRELAEKFFPGQNPLGQEIIGLINNEEFVFTVSAVFEDIPENSSLKVTCCIHVQWAIDEANLFSGVTDADRKWNHTYGYTWILLPDEIHAYSIEDQFRNFEKKYPGSGSMDHYSLQNLSEVYLHSENIEDWPIVGDLKKIKVLLSIVLIIVLVSTSNYIILYTAMSSSRVKEIGIRKTFGAGKSDIRKQMLVEAILLSVLVLPGSMLLMWLMLPPARSLFHSYLHYMGSNLIVYILFSLALFIFIALISGLYITAYLSRLKVLDVFKSPGVSGKSKQYLRSGLIVLQLLVFCCFVECTLIVRKQYQFAIDHYPGYYTKDILYIYLGNDFKGYESYLNDVMSNPEVILAAGVQQSLPLYEMQEFRHRKNENDSCLNELGLAGDYNFLETMGIKLVQGRYFSKEFVSDLNHAVILNEKEVKRLRLKEPIGFAYVNHTVIGVVKDFSPLSIHSDIPPMEIMVSNSNLNIIAVHAKPGTYKILIQKLEAQWKKYNPDGPFHFTTVENEINYRYASEKDLVTIVSIVAIFTFLVAVFGLFGLTFFLVRARTKEIGIKKVHGCSQRAILFSILFEYNLLVFIATLLSIPITLHFMNNWLNNFASRINMSAWVFVSVYFVAMAVVLLTLLYHAIKASNTDPVNALKCE